MISTPQQFSVLFEELSASTWTIAAIHAFFDSGLADALAEPRTQEELPALCPRLSAERIRRIVAVARARGLVVDDAGKLTLAPGVRHLLDPAPRRAFYGEVRSALQQAAASLVSPAGGWTHTDPQILQAQGDSSTHLAVGLKMRFAAELDGMMDRIAAPSFRFLDVGVGVGSLAIAMCRVFPNVRVVGLDPAQAAIDLAERNVAGAGVADRVELRAERVEDLREEDAFDLVWLPSFFLGSRDAVARAMTRIHAALKPGGWVLSPGVSSAAGEAQRAIWSFVLDTWNGPALDDNDIQSLLGAAGFTPRAFGGPSWFAMVAGRK